MRRSVRRSGIRGDGRAWLAGMAGLLLLLAAGCGEELPAGGEVAEGYERVVLAELFTAVWCGNCPLSEEALDRLVDEEGFDHLAVIHWHPSFGPGDPFAFAGSDARVEVMQALLGEEPGLPVCVFDALSAIPEGSAESYALYRARYEQEAAVATPVALELTAALEGNQARGTITLTRFPGTADLELDLTLVAVEHDAANPTPTGLDTLSYVARARSTASVTLGSGQSPLREMALTLDPAWKREDLYLVAFVEESSPPAGTTLREVLQAAMVPLVSPEEDFFAFQASAPDTAYGIGLDKPRLIPLTFANTGTLDDTLSIDLPLALQEIPKSWMVSLTDSAGVAQPTPLARSLGAGEQAGDLGIEIAAPVPGSGTIGLVVTSHGNPALADTLTFTLGAGTYGFTLSAADTALSLIAGTAGYAPLTIEGTGTLDDTLSVALPSELQTLPTGWSVGLADEEGGTLATPYTFFLPARGEAPRLQVTATATGEGEGSFGLVLTSAGDDALADTLVFTLSARAYDVRLTSAQPELWVVVGSPRVAAFTITNTGGASDLLRLDLPPALQALPAGWSVSLVYGDLVLGETHLLMLEAGHSTSLFGLRIAAADAGAATVRLVATSSGDPSATDTLALAVTADAYGFALSAPGGTTIALEPESPVLADLAIQNTGTLADTLTVDLPATLSDLPEGWSATLADPGGDPLATPYDLSLAAGASETALRLRLAASEDGSGTVGLVVASRGQPAIRDTLTFTLTASSVSAGVELSAETTTVTIDAPEVFIQAPFTLTNTGSAADVIDITLPEELIQIPVSWSPFILCGEGQCFPFGVTLELDAGESISAYFVETRASFEPGVGNASIVAVSQAAPAVTDTLTLTFQTSWSKRLGQNPGGDE